MNELKEVLKTLNELRDEVYKTKPLLRLNEVVVLSGLSKSSIYKLTSSRGIPHYKSGKRLIFDRREILDWLKSNKVATVDEIRQKASTYTSKNK